MLAKMFPGAVEASFHRSDTGVQSLCYFGMTAPFLNEREKGSILGPQLTQCMTQRIELLRVHRSSRLRNVFVLLAEREKDSPQLLPPQLIDTGVPRESEQPRLELGRSLQTIERADHFDENLLGKIFHVITSTGHGVNEAGDPMLIADNELSLGGFVALLSPPHEVGQSIR
jgi:hypothetical protein